MLSELCRRFDIPVPDEYTKESLEQLQDKFKPVVAKPRTGAGASGLIFIEKKEDLELLDKIDFDTYIVQEKIGNMRNVNGAFFLFNKGKCISYYGHRRIRTFPPSGGVTVFSAFDDNQIIKHIGTSLLEKLNWSGFAMIEFLYDEHADTYKIIEINPRLWGSFILSEFSGTGFLQNYIYSSVGRPIIKHNNVRKDVYIRWFFPFDLMNYVVSFGRIKNFWKLNLKNTCYINFSYSNFFKSFIAIPFIYFYYIKQFFKRMLGFRIN
jgi:predicted ATP-grasp superfamily ATP-dependent carboligase